MRVGQLTTVALVALGIAWIPFMRLISAQILHFAIVLFLACSAVLVAVSLLTPPPPVEHLRGLTFGAGGAARLEPHSPRFALTAGLSIILLATVAGVWVYFR